MTLTVIYFGLSLNKLKRREKMKKTILKLFVLLLTFVMIFSSCKKKNGVDGQDGKDGQNGKSAYELAQDAGFKGTLDEWLLTLVGEKGEIGAEVTDITLLSSEGLKDTYQITFSNGTKQTFVVTNGSAGVGIADITIVSSIDNIDTYSITLSNGEAKTFTVTNGDKGDKGDTGATGKSAYEIAVEQGFEGDVQAWLLSLVGEKGDLGAEVSSVMKTESSGLVDTYTIIFSNGLVSTFTVTNANSIVKIEKTASSGLIDIYTITMSDGTTYPFTVTNGAKGDKGDTGPQGIQGEKGEKGDKGDKGDIGRTVEFRVEGSWLQWKYSDEDNSAWRNLYETDGTPAPEDLLSVRFVLNGGGLVGSSETVYVTSGISIELPVPEKHGYSFIGWYENLSDTYPVPNTYRVHESTKLYAKWEAGAIVNGTKIYNLNDFMKIKDNLGGTYVLMNDINCNGLAIPIIGEDATNSFRGVFEGQGYTISNFTASSNQYMGLFGYSTGTIRNVNVADFNFIIGNSNTSDRVYIGGVTGYNAGIIESCGILNGNIEVTLNNALSAGLVAGESTGKVINCYVTGNVYATQAKQNENWRLAGGVVGGNIGEISNCFVSATTYSYGFKDNSFPFSDSYRGEAALVCAVNEKGGTVNNCVIMGSVLCGNNRVGDVAGRSNGTITGCLKADTVNIVQNSGTIYTYAEKISLANLSNADLYSATLGWDPSIWNFTLLDFAGGTYPTLIQK